MDRCVDHSHAEAHDDPPEGGRARGGDDVVGGRVEEDGSLGGDAHKLMHFEEPAGTRVRNEGLVVARTC